jgi:hypothetical protein
MTNNQRMGRMALVVLILGYAAAHEAAAETYFGFSIGINSAPPPPRVVVSGAPQLSVVAGTSVQVVGNSSYDVFAYRSSYYCFNGGFWYRSASHDGPFAVVDVRSVPEPILVVPAKNWKHHPHGGPPGQTKKSNGNNKNKKNKGRG